jgi:hypothetical protein
VPYKSKYQDKVGGDAHIANPAKNGSVQVKLQRQRWKLCQATLILP